MRVPPAVRALCRTLQKNRLKRFMHTCVYKLHQCTGKILMCIDGIRKSTLVVYSFTFHSLSVVCKILQSTIHHIAVHVVDRGPCTCYTTCILELAACGAPSCHRCASASTYLYLDVHGTRKCGSHFTLFIALLFNVRPHSCSRLQF